MASELLNSTEAARRLGISVASLYDWLARSQRDEFLMRGQPCTINYLQGGAQGQGRIQIEVVEIERLKDAMRVQPQPKRRLQYRPRQFPGINVRLGRPDQ